MSNADVKKLVPAVASVASPKTAEIGPSTSVKPPSSKQYLKSECEPGNGLNSKLETNSAPQIALPETQLLPPIPVRSSSNSKFTSSTTLPESGQAVGVLTETSLPDLKVNARAGSRSGSVASSKQSRKATETLPATSNIITSGANIQSTPSNEKEKQPKKRVVCRFLHFLNCCSGSDDATVDSHTQPVPAKSKGLPQMRGRLPTPAVKPTPSAADSSPGESKEANDENIGGPAYLEHTPALEPTMHSSRSNEALSLEKTDSTEKTAKPEHAEFSEKTDKTVLQENEANSSDEKEDLADLGQSLPPPQAAKSPAAYTDESKQIKPVVPITVSSTEVDDSSLALLPIDKIANKEAASDYDRSPQQQKKDCDVLMADAPPIAPAVEGSSNDAENRDGTRAQVNLPPPPPRNGQDRAGGIGRTPSNAATENEKQQYLLPPLQPRFKGKKCLVLDLDETLVHSSFKVRFHCFTNQDFIYRLSLDTPSGRFHDTRRDRGPVSQRLCH